MNYVVRVLGVEDVDEFRRVRLDALRLHPEAFIASYETSVSSIVCSSLKGWQHLADPVRRLCA